MIRKQSQERTERFVRQTHSYLTIRKTIYHGKINDANEPEAIPKIPIMENNIRKALAGKTIEKDFDPSIGFPSIQFLV
jgi:hypothetical protein